jgi:(2Fe-2S) ferredoxin
MNDQPREIALCISPYCSLFPYRGYNRAKKGSVVKKTAYRGINKHDLPEVIQEHHSREKISNKAMHASHLAGE